MWIKEKFHLKKLHHDVSLILEDGQVSWLICLFKSSLWLVPIFLLIFALYYGVKSVFLFLPVQNVVSRVWQAKRVIVQLNSISSWVSSIWLIFNFASIQPQNNSDKLINNLYGSKCE